jgi:urea transport system permease protein
VGGRATLIGPIAGAFIVNGAKSWLTVAYPEFWLYFLGLLFIAVTLFLPEGVVGLVKKIKQSIFKHNKLNEPIKPVNQSADGGAA